MVQEIKFDEDECPYIEICEGYTVRLELDEIDQISQEKARKELRETAENVDKGMAELRQLLKDDQDLYVPYEIDEFLIKFLRPCKFYAQNAYELIKRYYRFKQKFPKYCKNLTPATARVGFENNVIKFQPKRDQNGARILILHGGREWNPSIVPLADLFKAIQLSLEVAMLEPMTQVNGCITIIDMQHLSLHQIMQFTPSFANMLLEWVQQCIPIRLKAVHIVYNSALFNMLFAVFKPFISAKLRHRIHFHGHDMKSLLKHIDSDRLPKKYGGTIPCEDVDGKLVAELLDVCEEELTLANTFGFFGNANRQPIKLPERLIKKLDRNQNTSLANVKS